MAQTLLRDSSGRFVSPTKKNTPKHSEQRNLQIILVVDVSMSMGRFHSNIVGLCNKFIDIHKNQQIAYPQYLTVITFSDYVLPLFIGEPLGEIKQLDRKSFCIGGRTALFDAVEYSILKTRGNTNDIFIAYIITDGEENYSITNASKTHELLNTVQGTDRWTVTFSVPTGYGKRLQKILQIPSGNIQEWNVTTHGIEEMFSSIAVGTQTYYNTTLKSGKTQSLAFFQTDLSRVDVSCLHKISSSTFKVWKITKEIPIKEFVELQGFQYTISNAFYEITKKETIQEHKHLYLMEKNKKTLYGNTTRIKQMLGLPMNETIKIDPYNHANYRLFVQSTSVNRKLVRGSYLLYFM
jgi:uncharacterized protein YegL